MATPAATPRCTDAQFYLLLAGYDAEAALAEWQSMAVSQYAV